jgi:cysteine sulfinate desulfinase/cysteine desulfurase-like protein
MTKKLSAIIMALIFAASISGIAVAASLTCTVETIEAGKVLLNCGDKADKLEAGTKVKVKPATTRTTIEGC